LFSGQDHDGDEVKKPYTPITHAGQQGYAEVLIKFYRPRGEFIGGDLTTYLDTLQAGDQLTIDGPVGKHKYLGSGSFNL